MRKVLASLASLAVMVMLVTGCLTTDPLHAEFTVTPQKGLPLLLVRFDARTSWEDDGHIVAYDWDFDADGLADDHNATAEHVFTEQGIHPVTLTVIGSAGATALRTHDVQVLSLPPVPDFDWSPRPAVEHEETWFDASNSVDPDGEIVQFVWSFGDGSSDQGPRVAHVYRKDSPAYSVTLTVTDQSGVSRSTTKQVRVVCGESCQ